MGRIHKVMGRGVDGLFSRDYLLNAFSFHPSILPASIILPIKLPFFRLKRVKVKLRPQACLEPPWRIALG